MPTNMGIVTVTFGALRTALGLPDDIKVIRVLEPEDWKRQNSDKAETVELVLEGPGLPAVWEGATLPYVTVVFDGRGVLHFDH